MIPYIVVYMILFICSILETSYCKEKDILIWESGEKCISKIYTNKLIRNFCMIICIISVSLFLIFSDVEMGKDYNNYFRYFKEAYHYNWNDIIFLEDIDIGYVYLNKIFLLFSNNFIYFRAFIHMLNFIVIVYVADKKSSYISVSIMIYFVLINFTYMYLLRESTAISLSFLAYYEISRKKYILSALIIIISLSIHLMSIVFILIIFIDIFFKKPIKLKQFIIINFITIILFIVMGEFIMSFYRDGRYQELKNQGGYKLYIVLFFISMILWISVKYYINHFGIYNKNIAAILNFNYSEDLIKWFNIFIFILIVQSCALVSSVLTRIVPYMLIYIILIVPKLLRYPKFLKNRICWVVVLGVIGFMWLVFTQTPYDYVVQDFTDSKYILKYYK